MIKVKSKKQYEAWYFGGTINDFRGISEWLIDKDATVRVIGKMDVKWSTEVSELLINIDEKSDSFRQIVVKSGHWVVLINDAIYAQTEIGVFNDAQFHNEYVAEA